MAPENGQTSVETEVNLEWEDFFGPSTELMPSLLSMYDALAASESLGLKRKTEKATSSPSSPRKLISRQGSDPSVRLRYVVLQRSASLGRGAQPNGDYISRSGARPLSLSSTSSSSSSLPNPGSRPSQAYLASIESLEDNNDVDFSDEDVESNAVDSNIENDTSSSLNMSSLPGQHPNLRSSYDGKLSHSERVIQEILETEKIYVRDVEEVIKGYLNVMKSGNKDWGITAEQIDVLFGNLEEIHAFNRSFLEDLEECEGDAIRVAQCFVRHNSGFAIYTQYCTNYPRTVDVLTELMCNKAAGTAFRERQVKLGHTLPLGSYLLKPVQRILKYHLLLENLVKYMDQQSLGYNDVWAALNTMTGIAHHINEMKRKHERAVRVQEVQSLLFGWEGADLTTYGELAAEGTFRMYGAKALRHVFLFDRILFIVKRKDDGSLVYKAHIMCSNLMLVESVPGEPLTFHVIPFDNPRCQYTLQAHSMEQKREWTLQLKRVILENYDADIPLKAKQLVMQLGQERLDEGLAFRRSSTNTRRQHSAPEYLERRKADRRKELSLNSKLKIRRARRRMGVRQKENSVTSHENSLTTDCNDSLNTTKDSDEEDDERKKSIISDIYSNDSQCDWRRYSPGNYTSLEDEVFDSESAAEPSQYTSSKLRDNSSIEEVDDVRVETLEEIIGQLLMQNMEFRKMLSRRHQRRQKLNSRQEDTTDTENEDNNNQSDSFAYIRSNRIPLRVPPPTPTSPTPGPQTEHTYGLCFNTSDSVPAANDSGCMSDAEVLDGSGASRTLRRRTKSFCSERAGASILCAYPVKSLQNMSDVWEKRQTLLRNRYNSDNSKVNSPDTQPYHPSHRVYKKSLSKSSLKSILTTVSSRLKSTVSQSTLDTQTSCSDCEDRETVYSSRSTNSQVYNFARQCSKVLKARVKQLVTETSDDNVWNHSWNSSSASRHYHVRKQGSSEIGARIAASTEPTTVRKLSQSTSRLSVSESGYNFSGVALRPDSVLSVSSNATSSSDGDKTSGFGGSVEVSMVSPDLLGQFSCHSDGENPPDVLYESTLDVLDHLEDTEVYRDSAIYSDPDDLDPAYVEKLYSESRAAPKVPPPVPEKPKNRHSKPSKSVANIVPYHRGDSQELDGIKSIDERRKELEIWKRGEAVGDESESSSQHSTSTINTVIENGVVINKMVSCEVYCEPIAEQHLPKGWVRHVIGKLQGDASLFNSAQ